MENEHLQIVAAITAIIGIVNGACMIYVKTVTGNAARQADKVAQQLSELLRADHVHRPEFEKLDTAVRDNTDRISRIEVKINLLHNLSQE